MSDERFVYVTYIASTPDKVWTALLESDVTRKYWGGHVNVPTSGWKKGSQWKHIADSGNGTVRVVGEVLEIVPQRRLVLSWSDPDLAGDKSKQTRVAMDIEMADDKVRLTVVHDELYPDMARRITYGWPLVLSSLKSYLETGRALMIFAPTPEGVATCG